MEILRKDENVRFIQEGYDHWTEGTLVAARGFINTEEDEIFLFGFVGNGRYLLVKRAEIDGHEIDIHNVQYRNGVVEYTKICA